MNKYVQAVLSLILLFILAIPAVRQMTEASMWRHMIVQFPLWMLAGGLFANVVPVSMRKLIAGWNKYGITGLVLTAVVLSVLMIPRVLDQALLYPEIELAKLSALFLAGMTLVLSWRSAGMIVQSFYLGNMLPMMGVVGWLYTESPLRLCNAYLLDDQIRLGNWLIGIAIVIAVGWLSWIAWFVVRAEMRQTSHR